MNSMDYAKGEKAHDKLLIKLMKDLAEADRLDIFERAFETGKLGCLESARHRRLFDIGLTFQNGTIVVESKVDSDEGGRWNDEWQTCRIARKAPSLADIKEPIQYRLVTYGTAEFYTKVVDNQYRTGAASSRFMHITLERMIEFVEDACAALGDPNGYRSWVQAMQVEARKRSAAPSFLNKFATFRHSYLEVNNDNDFSRKRLLICMPELAFPVFDALAKEWRTHDELLQEFGDVSVYPVGRMSPSIHDSILNLWGLWCRGVGKQFVACGFYFEINEDFNLNVKTENEMDRKSKESVWSALDDANWTNFAVGVNRDYRQTNLTLYEIDFGFLSNVQDIPTVAMNLAAALRAAVDALKRLRIT